MLSTGPFDSDLWRRLGQLVCWISCTHLKGTFGMEKGVHFMQIHLAGINWWPCVVREYRKSR